MSENIGPELDGAPVVLGSMELRSQPMRDAGRRSRARSASRRRHMRRQLAADSVFVLPALAVLAIVIAIPAGSALQHSFTNWNPGSASPFTGLANYKRALEDPVFHQALGNQLFLVLGVPFWTCLPLLVATLLYERTPFAKFFRSVYFFPSILSPAVLAIMFRDMLAQDGALNQLLGLVGLGALKHAWVGDATLVKPTLIFVLAWTQMGTGVVIFSSALSTVPSELDDSAKVDGASWWQRFRYVLIPSILPTIVFYAAYQVIYVFLWVFTWIYVLTFGGPGYSSTTVDYLIYTSVFRDGFFGTAAAQSAMLLVIVLILLSLTLVARRLAVRASMA